MFEIDESRLPRGVQIDSKELGIWQGMIEQKPIMPPAVNAHTVAYSVSSNLRTPFVLSADVDVQRQFYRNGAKLTRFMPNQGTT